MLAKNHPCLQVLKESVYTDIAELIWSYAKPVDMTELISYATETVCRARRITRDGTSDEQYMRQVYDVMRPLFYSLVDITDSQIFISRDTTEDVNTGLRNVMKRLTEYFPHIGIEYQIEILCLCREIGLRFLPSSVAPTFACD